MTPTPDQRFEALREALAAFWASPSWVTWWELEAAALDCGMAPLQHIIPWANRALAAHDQAKESGG